MPIVSHLNKVARRKKERECPRPGTDTLQLLYSRASSSVKLQNWALILIPGEIPPDCEVCALGSEITHWWPRLMGENLPMSVWEWQVRCCVDTAAGGCTGQLSVGRAQVPPGWSSPFAYLELPAGGLQEPCRTGLYHLGEWPDPTHRTQRRPNYFAKCKPSR